MQALVFETFGPPDILQYRELPDPIVGKNEIQVALGAAGLNFADIYRRQGNYALHGSPPYILGYEGAGVVVAIGSDAHNFHIGDRVAFADVPRANATLVNVPADHAIALPADISFDAAAAILLQGLTALYLVEDSAGVSARQTVLIHAAAGGVGLALVQLAKARGATVIALASTPEKRQAATDAGADYTLALEDWPANVRQLVPRGVDVVFDSIGATLSDSIDATSTRGMIITYGMAGGDPLPVNPRRLMERSLVLKGGDLWDYLTSAHERTTRANKLFAAIKSGFLRLPPIHRFALSQGAEAHRLLESRTLIGKIVLTT
jgi:NADPH:quinone reductase